MQDYRALEQRFESALQLTRRPVAICFLDTPPNGVAKFQGSQPSSCSFWKVAAEGKSFYTVPEDHQNCPVGAYTQAVLAPETMPQLSQSLELMAGLGYVRMEEVPRVFHLARTPRAIAYAPLGDVDRDPDAVIFTGKPGRIMLLAEAGIRAGAMSTLPLLARPTCMAIPAAMTQGAVTSAGCIGNRIYTGIGEDELYMVVPGKSLEAMAEALATVAAANTTLTQYHEERRTALTRG